VAQCASGTLASPVSAGRGLVGPEGAPLPQSTVPGASFRRCASATRARAVRAPTGEVLRRLGQDSPEPVGPSRTAAQSRSSSESHSRALAQSRRTIRAVSPSASAASSAAHGGPGPVRSTAGRFPTPRPIVPELEAFHYEYTATGVDTEVGNDRLTRREQPRRHGACIKGSCPPTPPEPVGRQTAPSRS
jgi:hypothetical protein